MHASSKIVVFTGDLNYSLRTGIIKIDRAITGLSWLIVVYSPNKTASKLLWTQWRSLPRNGWRWIFYQLSEIRRSVLVRVPVEPRRSFPGGEFTMAALRSLTNIQLSKVANIRSTDTLDAVDTFAPDLGLSLAAPILPLSECSANSNAAWHSGSIFGSTGIIGTGRRFPHDIRRGNPYIPTMQWDHLREMREARFHDRIALYEPHRLCCRARGHRPRRTRSIGCGLAARAGVGRCSVRLSPMVVGRI